MNNYQYQGLPSYSFYGYLNHLRNNSTLVSRPSAPTRSSGGAKRGNSSESPANADFEPSGPAPSITDDAAGVAGEREATSGISYSPAGGRNGRKFSLRGYYPNIKSLSNNLNAFTITSRRPMERFNFNNSHRSIDNKRRQFLQSRGLKHGCFCSYWWLLLLVALVSTSLIVSNISVYFLMKDNCKRRQDRQINRNQSSKSSIPTLQPDLQLRTNGARNENYVKNSQIALDMRDSNKFRKQNSFNLDGSMKPYTSPWYRRGRILPPSNDNQWSSERTNDYSMDAFNLGPAWDERPVPLYATDHQTSQGYPTRQNSQVRRPNPSQHQWDRQQANPNLYSTAFAFIEEMQGEETGSPRLQGNHIPNYKNRHTTQNPFLKQNYGTEPSVGVFQLEATIRIPGEVRRTTATPRRQSDRIQSNNQNMQRQQAPAKWKNFNARSTMKQYSSLIEVQPSKETTRVRKNTVVTNQFIDEIYTPTYTTDALTTMSRNTDPMSPTMPSLTTSTTPIDMETMRPLTDDIIPLEYILKWQPDLSFGDFRFNGSLDVVIVCARLTRVIAIHSDRLSITNPQIYSLKNETMHGIQTYRIERMFQNKENQMIHFFLNKNLRPGNTYILSLHFSGRMHNKRDHQAFYFANFTSIDNATNQELDT